MEILDNNSILFPTNNFTIKFNILSNYYINLIKFKYRSTENFSIII